MLTAILVGACAEPEPAMPEDAAAEEPVPVDGSPCATAEDRCLADGSRLRCEAGFWELTDCRESCAPNQEFVGCTQSLFGSARCECVAPPPAGEWPEPQPGPPQVACLDAHTLQQCSADDGCTTAQCTDLCAAESRTSIGCFDGYGGCYCSGAGTPCPEDAEPRCDGVASLAACVDGQWVVQVCANVCDEPEQPACRLEDDGTSACRCAEAT